MKTLAKMSDRVRKLEKEIASLKKKSSAVGSASIAARAFILLDENSNPRGGLRMTADGPEFFILDGNGVSRMTLGLSKSKPSFFNGLKNPLNPVLRLYNDNGEERAALEVSPRGSKLKLASQDVDSRVEITAIKDDASVYLSSKHGSVAAAADHEGASLKFSDHNMRFRYYGLPPAEGMGYSQSSSPSEATE